MIFKTISVLFLLCTIQLFGEEHVSGEQKISVGNYHSIQQAIETHPGKMIYLPAGDYKISEKIKLRSHHGGLYGAGRIIQSNPEAPIIEIEGASSVQLRGITLQRAEGKMKTKVEAVLAINCKNLDIDHVQIYDNRTRSGAIAVRNCAGVRITNCLVQNYMQITVDDRTGSSDWGYAFNCIDGSGIVVTESQSVLIQGNRVIENRLLPTPEIQKEFDLGKIIKRNPVKGTIISEQTWNSDHVSNWHQGSAIIVSSPESSGKVQILGNNIENAAQGIDIHADHVVVSQNIVNNAFVGMKAMHGSRHIIIIGNQFIKNDLWSIGLMPGAASHAASAGKDGKTSKNANIDGGSIIANNIISEFGYGHAHWIWKDNGSPIKLDAGQKPTNPPLKDVIIQGNIVYNSGRDELKTSPDNRPRYRFAIVISSEVQGLHFSNNILHPGHEGVSNISIKP